MSATQTEPIVEIISEDIIDDSQPAVLNAVVKSKSKDSESWKEVADVVSYSPTGAGFYMARQVSPGQLISLMLPLPAEMRCYDHDKEFYRVWGVVQFCQKLNGEDNESYHIGVAFTGKNAPPSYNEDPERHFRICGMNTDGLWRIEPAKAAFKIRRDVRFWQSIECYVALVDKEKKSLSGAKSVTENVSKSGAAVFSTLDVNVGDRVKLICEPHDYSGLAIVCNRQNAKDGRMRLHLNFVDAKFPVENLKLVEAKN
ncbi:MAG: PilZ domain-containing protein [Acidobacteria bacterium]|nr:PilZ domain-containing protein [Acidobacteriota bacterium]